MIGNDPSEVDLDLCLFVEHPDNEGEPLYIDCSMGTGPIESVSIPATGEYFFEIFPWSGCECGSTYVLTAGQTSGQAHPTMRLSDDFVAGEAIVKMRHAPLVMGAARERAEGAARAIGTRTVNLVVEAPDGKRYPMDTGLRWNFDAALKVPALPVRKSRMSSTEPNRA